MTMVNYIVISFIVYTYCGMRNNLRKAKNVLVSLNIVNEKLDSILQNVLEIQPF